MTAATLRSTTTIDALRRVVSDAYRVPFDALDVRILPDPSTQTTLLIVACDGRRGSVRFADVHLAASADAWDALQRLALEAASWTFGDRFRREPRAVAQPLPDPLPDPLPRRAFALDGRL